MKFGLIFPPVQTKGHLRNKRRKYQNRIRSALHFYFMNQVWRKDSIFSAGNDGLEFSGVSLKRLGLDHGTPLYVYSARRIRENIERLRSALRTTGLDFEIRYAMKSNRFGPVMDLIRAEGDIGIDACSPREVQLALSHGFLPEEISVTASNLSNADLLELASYKVHLNSDSASVARRFGAYAENGATFGIRLNPERPLIRENGTKLNYVGGKIGVHDMDFDPVYKAACNAGLIVNTLHVHCGWAMQAQHAEAFESAVRLLAERYYSVPGIKFINVGGGLSHPHNTHDAPLPVGQWATIIRKHLGTLTITLQCEIGTFITANAGILVSEITTVERRAGALWIGVNSNHAVNTYPYHYGIPLELIPVNRPKEPAQKLASVGSNINEAEDLLATSVYLPDVQEGEFLAQYCTGAYGASMMSDHCMRGQAKEVLID